MNKVVVCAVTVKDPPVHDAGIIARMPEIRRLRYLSAEDPRLRAQLAAAQSALDGALSALLPDYAPPADFMYLPDGRPAVRGTFISISHTGPLAVCAAAHIPVGIDTEDRDRPFRPALARRILSPGEETPGGMTGTWVDKEAFLKLTGQGISGGMNRYTVRGDAVYGPDDTLRARIVRAVCRNCLISVCCHDDFFVEFAAGSDALPEYPPSDK